MTAARALWLSLATLAGLAWPFLPTALGIVLLAVGAGMAWLPLGFMVPGALLLADRVAVVVWARTPR